MHPARLSICKFLEQGQATHEQRYCSESEQFGGGQVAQKTTPLLVIPEPGLSGGICLVPAAKQQIPRATMPRFGITILWGFSNYNTTNSSASASRPLEIVYNKKCCLRPDDESPSKATDNHFLPLHVLQRDGRSVDSATSAPNSRRGRQPAHHGTYARAAGHPRL